MSSCNAEHGSRTGNSAGFLLLEAVIALAVIGLVAVAILGSAAAQLRSADKASVLLVAQALAEDRITVFRILGYEDLRRPPDSLLAGTFPPPFDEFTWTASVEPVDGEHELFSLEVVTGGRGESFPLHTLLHRPQPLILAGGES